MVEQRAKRVDRRDPERADQTRPVPYAGERPYAAPVVEERAQRASRNHKRDFDWGGCCSRWSPCCSLAPSSELAVASLDRCGCCPRRFHFRCPHFEVTLDSNICSLKNSAMAALLDLHPDTATRCLGSGGPARRDRPAARDSPLVRADPAPTWRRSTARSGGWSPTSSSWSRPRTPPVSPRTLGSPVPTRGSRRPPPSRVRTQRVRSRLRVSSTPVMTPPRRPWTLGSSPQTTRQ